MKKTNLNQGFNKLTHATNKLVILLKFENTKLVQTQYRLLTNLQGFIEIFYGFLLSLQLPICQGGTSQSVQKTNQIE